MNHLFSIGELSRLQNISRQTLIFYDKIGLFCPAYVHPETGYRYYSASQLDALDTICMMKKIGFSLEEIKAHMQNYTIDNSLAALKKQLTVIEQQIEDLQMISSRVKHRCHELEHVIDIRGRSEQVTVEPFAGAALLVQAVKPPYSLEEVSIATKQCFVRAFHEHLPVYYQSGAIVPLSRIRQGRYVEASHVFLPIEAAQGTQEVITLPPGRCAITHHTGDYLSIGSAYERILTFCDEKNLTLTSDSYEFALNDYLSTGDESEYVTKIMFYIREA